MKTSNKIIILMLSVLLPIGFVGCSDDDDNGISTENNEIPELALDQESVKVKIGPENKITLNIKQGGGEYNAFILDENIAKAEVTDGVITVEGFANGQTSLILSDKYSRYKRFNVSAYTTDVLKLSHESFNLVTKLGNSQTLKANVELGNGGYQAISDNPKVSVSVNEEGEISLTATSKKEEFMANVTITDCTGLSANISVTVTSTLEPFSDEELEAITSNTTRRYYFNNSKTDQSYYSYINTITEDGKQRYGWDYYSYYWLYLDFSGDKSVGVKDDAVYTYHTWSVDTNQPVTLKIIKNDGKNIWGVFSYVDDEQEKLYTGYFCDFVDAE